MMKEENNLGVLLIDDELMFHRHILAVVLKANYSLAIVDILYHSRLRIATNTFECTMPRTLSIKEPGLTWILERYISCTLQ